MQLSVAINKASKAAMMVAHYGRPDIVNEDPIRSAERLDWWTEKLLDAQVVMRAHGMEV